MLSYGAQLVGVVPGADVTGLDPDDDSGTVEGLHIRGGGFRAFIPGGTVPSARKVASTAIRGLSSRSRKSSTVRCRMNGP